MALSTIETGRRTSQRRGIVQDIRADILIFGTGNFAGRIALDLAATASEPVTVVIAGRNRDRLKWLRTAGNARAAMFDRPARFVAHEVDLSVADAAAEAIAAVEPKVVVQAASFQTGNVISNQGNAWTKLVAEGGLSATAVLQAPLSIAVARAVKAVRPQAHFINCCFRRCRQSADCRARFADHVRGRKCRDSRQRVRRHARARSDGSRCWRTIKTSRRGGAPPRRAAAASARVWIDDEEVADVYRALCRRPTDPRTGDRDFGRERRAADACDGARARLGRARAGTARPARRLSGPAQGG